MQCISVSRSEGYEPREMNYVKFNENQLPMVERTLYSASRRAGTNNSKAYSQELGAPAS